MTEVSNAVTNTFKYKITASQNNPAPVVGLPETFEIAFNAVAPNGAGVATQEKLIDVGLAQFSRVGEYEFHVTEESSSNEVVYPHDSSHSFDLTALVRNVLDAEGRPTGSFAVSFLATVWDCNTHVKIKDAVFSRPANHDRIVVRSNVTGTGADAEQYFMYKLLLLDNGWMDGFKLTTRGLDAEVEYKGKKVQNPSQVEVGKINVFYMKHGQVATFGSNNSRFEVPIGLKYSIMVEEDQGYTFTYDGTPGKVNNTNSKRVRVNPGEGASEEELKAYNKSVFNDFVFNKEASVLTGVAMELAPYMGFVALLGGAVFVVYKLSKRA